MFPMPHSRQRSKSRTTPETTTAGIPLGGHPSPPHQRRAWLAVAGALLGLIAGTVTATTIFKWTDEEGKVHYSDSPPKGQDYQTFELDTSGAQKPAENATQSDEASQEEASAVSATEINLTEAKIRVRKLEQKVQQAQSLYEKARKNRIEGERIRLGSEQNYVRYLERIEKLKQQEKAAKERLDRLRSQLEQAQRRLQKLQEKAHRKGP